MPDVLGPVMTNVDGRTLGTAAVVGLGVLLVASGVYDFFVDAHRIGEPVPFAVLEHAPFVLLAAMLVVAGVWLHRSEMDSEYVLSVATWTVGITAGVVLVLVWVFGIQIRIASNVQPFVVAGDTVVIGAAMAFVLGVYDARRRQRRDELAVERDEFATLYENVPNPVVSVVFRDGTPRVRDVNPAFETQFGYGADDVQGDRLESYVAPGEGAANVLPERGAFENADSTPTELQLHTETGLRTFLRLTTDVGADETAHVILVDVTERQQRRQRLDVLSRVLRHNVRNKLTVIKGNAENIQRTADGEHARFASMIADAAEDVQSISESAHQLETLVTSEYERERVNVSELVDDAVEAVRETFAEERVEVEIDRDIPESMDVDGTAALSFAVEAVIENAVDHANSPEPRVEVRAEYALDGEFVDLSIADDGPGIPPAERQVVVGEAEQTQLQHGSGLGLWGTNWVVTDVGGELAIDADGDGSVVTLRLPRWESDGDDESEAGDDDGDAVEE